MATCHMITSDPCSGPNEYWWPLENPLGRPKMSTSDPSVWLIDPYFFQNEYSKPLLGTKSEYWPFETIPFDNIIRVYAACTRNNHSSSHNVPCFLSADEANESAVWKVLLMLVRLHLPSYIWQSNGFYLNIWNCDYNIDFFLLILSILKNYT